MSLIYIHLSDIHFGQENGGQYVVNADAKRQLVSDVRSTLQKMQAQASGIIISGDIAYAGKKEEYQTAFSWISDVAKAAGCSPVDVQVVPGNHDIDRDLITNGAQALINVIHEKGDEALNDLLESESDRDMLYHRFSEYRQFAAGYNCGLDGEGSIEGHRVFEIAPGRYLKFYGINTALICSKERSEEGKLLLGQRQRVIDIEEGVETIVIGHHPPHWLQDSEDALRFIRNRARLFISGHEHMPSHRFERINDKSDFLSIASGATAPKQPDSTYTYCYNILEFSLNADLDRLIVKVHPRMWNDNIKAFGVDNTHFQSDGCTFELRCPNFTRLTKESILASPVNETANIIEITKEIEQGMSQESDQLLLLRFFKDLNSSERLTALVNLGVLPKDISDKVTHNIEVLSLRTVFKNGRSEELEKIINEILNSKTG